MILLIKLKKKKKKNKIPKKKIEKPIIVEQKMEPIEKKKKIVRKYSWKKVEKNFWIKIEEETK